MCSSPSSSQITRAQTPAIAFLVLCHADPGHLGRLVRALDHVGDVFVHIDGKTDAAPFRQAVAGFDVSFIAPRLHVRWGGLSMVRATVALMEAALSGRRPYTHLVLLSGACYPIRPLRELQALFAAAPEREFIRMGSVAEAGAAMRGRVCRYWLFDYIDVPGRRWTPSVLLRRVVRKALHVVISPIRKKPSSRLPHTELAHGSQWWAMTSACAAYVVKACRTRPDLWRFFATSFAPDEMLVHTIVANSPFARSTDKSRQPDDDHPASFANLHFIDRSLTKLFDEQDFDVIAASEYFFVRKVASERSTALLDRIDVELLGIESGSSNYGDTLVAA